MSGDFALHGGGEGGQEPMPGTLHESKKKQPLSSCNVLCLPGSASLAAFVKLLRSPNPGPRVFSTPSLAS